MKTVYKLLSICCLLLFVSCEDYLNVEQPSIYTDQNHYKTPKDCETAMNGCYSQLQDIYNRNYIMTIVYRCDEVRNSGQIGRFMDTAMESNWLKSYSSWWTLVYRCNQLLSRIENVPFMTDDDKVRKEYLIGEAHALRGLAYLQFAWCWGGVPLITKEMTLQEIYRIPRSSQEENYGQAIADFKEAFGRLPEKWASGEIGRVTRYAVSGLLGRTYMYMHNYQDAADELKKVIDQEKDGIKFYKMAANYQDCFDDKYNNTSERVWEVQYLANNKAVGLSQSFNGWFIPSDLNSKDYARLGINFIGSSGSVQASQSIYGIAEEKMGKGVYEDGDKRIPLTLINNLWSQDGKTQDAQKHLVKKFLIATQNAPTAADEWGNNISILRYTDVKLMYAEALNELNFEDNKDLIVSIINEVRIRAGLPLKESTDFAGKQEVFDYLVKERFLEFCFEGIRWPDLIRWNLAEEAMAAHFALTEEGADKNTGEPKYKMLPYHKLAPIPLADIQAYNNKAIMWQNEGY